MYYNIPDWWFGTFFIVPYIGNNHPNWLIFFRGVETPPTSNIMILVERVGCALMHGNIVDQPLLRSFPVGCSTAIW